jgi:hypothetical protein
VLPDCTEIVHGVLAGKAMDTSWSWPSASRMGLTRQSWALRMPAHTIAHTPTAERAAKDQVIAVGRGMVTSTAGRPSSNDGRRRDVTRATDAASCGLISLMFATRLGSENERFAIANRVLRIPMR